MDVFPYKKWENVGKMMIGHGIWVLYVFSIWIWSEFGVFLASKLWISSWLDDLRVIIAALKYFSG